MGSFSVLGKPAKTTILAIEEDKISIEFTAAVAIRTGQPVKLDADGRISLWAKTDSRDLLIGYAYTESTAANQLVTVFTRGFMLIYAMVKADEPAGPATYNGYDTTTLDDGQNLNYNVYAASGVAGTATQNGWMLDNAAASGDVVRVLLMD